jgi:tRNA C32,U32 (ribose-2'-O)-methylase TrmJ
MTLFLRNEKNETILDLEVWVKTEDSYSFVELSSSVDIKNYSLMLIKNTDKEKQIEMISDFDELSELRGWLWEVFFMVKKNEPKEYDSVVQELKVILKKVADNISLMDTSSSLAHNVPRVCVGAIC